MYNYILLIAIFGILTFVLYYRYNNKESFQNAKTDTTDTTDTIDPAIIDLAKNTTVLPPPEEVPAVPVINLSMEDAQAKLNSVAPIIAANPTVQGILNSDTGIDLSQIDFEKAKEQANAMTVPAVNDKRPATDIDRQCDTYKIQLDSLKANIKAYKMSQSWAQARDFSHTMMELKKHMSEIGC